MTQRTCNIVEREAVCGKPVVARGWCRKHYTRWQAHGDPLATKVIVGDDTARFRSKVDRRGPDECWPWLDKPDPFAGGYGRFHLRGETRLAHALAWEIANSRTVPAGHQIDHVCHNRAVAAGTCARGICPHRLCCNPAHLEAKLPLAHTVDTNASSRAHYLTVLSPALVAKIHALLASGLPGRVIAGLTGVSNSTVGRVRRGEDTFSMGRSA